MKPGYKLNLHSRENNPLFESHDPSMFWDEKSHTYYSYSTDAAITSQPGIGIPIRKSTNLIDFTFVGYALSTEAIAEGGDNVDGYDRTKGFWSPYVQVVVE